MQTPFKGWSLLSKQYILLKRKKVCITMILYTCPCVNTSEASLVTQTVEPACNVGASGSIPGSGRRKWQPTPVFLPGKSTVHGVAKSRARLRTSLFTFFSINTSPYVLRMSGLCIFLGSFLWHISQGIICIYGSMQVNIWTHI